MFLNINKPKVKKYLKKQITKQSSLLCLLVAFHENEMNKNNKNIIKFFIVQNKGWKVKFFLTLEES